MHSRFDFTKTQRFLQDKAWAFEKIQRQRQRGCLQDNKIAMENCENDKINNY